MRSAGQDASGNRGRWGPAVLLPLLVAVATASACHRAPEFKAQAAKAAVATEARYTAAPRLVAIGDLHGDLERTREALRLAGAIDLDDRWTGGRLVVVQTGDQLDRGDGERQILDLFERLAVEARSAGGAVHALLGNHETLNVEGKFRDVTEHGLRSFAGASPRAPGAERVEQRHRERAAALMPGGEYALKLAKRDVVAVVGQSVFVHGGVKWVHVEQGIDRINREVRDWIAGRAPAVPRSVSEKPSVLWTRDYGTPTVAPEICRELEQVLAAFGARRMVVGHTIQDAGISSACDGKVWRIDVGLSKVYGDRTVQVLEIVGDEVRVVSSR